VGELDRTKKDLARVSPESNRRPDIDKLVKIVRSLRSLIDRHRLPAGEKVDRALTTVESAALAPRTATAAALTSGRNLERLLPDLTLLREFIEFQRTELNDTLDILRNLAGRADTETETGDRPGSERGRPAEPVQVVTFSLPMEEGKKPARLKVLYPLKQNAAGGAGFRVSLLLSMDRMGSVRTDIYAHERHLDVNFSTETEPARRHIDGRLSRLRKILNGPFDTINLTTAVDEKSITAFEYEDLDLSDDRVVDLKA